MISRAADSIFDAYFQSVSRSFGVTSIPRSIHSPVGAAEDDAFAGTAGLKYLRRIADRDIQTSTINLNPEYRYADNQPPTLTGYSATNQLNIRFRDIVTAGLLPREDEVKIASIDVLFRLRLSLDVDLSYSYEKRDSNIPVYSYLDEMTALQIRWSF